MSIPKGLFRDAKGLVVVTVAKCGVFFTGKMGTGFVVARLSDGSWSAPSAVSLTGIGWGLQVGVELLDILLILTTEAAVEAFCSKTQVSVGSELGVSIGAIGRGVGTDIHGGEHGASAAISFSQSKGLFLGLSLEASVIQTRKKINRSFYGQDVKPSVLLSGAFPRPVGAAKFYQSLAELMDCCRSRNRTAVPLSLADDGEYGLKEGGEEEEGNKMTRGKTAVHWERRREEGGRCEREEKKFEVDEDVDEIGHEGQTNKLTNTSIYEDIRF
jgi:lipid-binding SYLF domain-containing protein